jgi:hypothetical protein
MVSYRENSGAGKSRKNMTLVLAWPNKEQDPTALHIAADSLLSDRKGNSWQYGPKLFRVFPTHDYLAYCGTSTLALSAILQGTMVLANTNILGRNVAHKPVTIRARVAALQTLFQESSRMFPEDWMNGPPTLIYCGFDRMTKSFRVFELAFARSPTNVVEKELRKDSPLLYGSGSSRARSLLRKLADTPTTKEVLKTLVSVIEDASVPEVGGVPQMATIWKEESQLVGLNREISGEPRSTLLGLPLYFHSDMTRVRFLDQQFRSSVYLHSAKLPGARRNRNTVKSLA